MEPANVDSHKTKLRNFLHRYISNHEFSDAEDIFASGFVNSLFAMQLVLFLENEFGITIGNEDLNLDNFRSIDALSSLILRKHPGTQPV